MKLFTSTLALLALSASVFAQNLVLSTQNPDGLYVCGTDQMGISVQNGAGNPAATNLKITVTLPVGITYVPGSVAGATESNIANLSAPIFALNDLAGGVLASFTLNLTADCPAVQAINNGQTFSNTITANYTGGSKQLVSSLYPVETGFLNIGTVTPPTTTAERGDVVMRMITMKNTRNGPILSLHISDAHPPGISVAVQGATNEVSLPTFYSGDLSNNFFTSIGDGDNLFEFGEELTIVEKVTIEDCGIPSFNNQSAIIIGWGCGGTTPCQQDTIFASVTILPTTQNPSLSFIPIYEAPLSQCGAVPSFQEILIVNNGELPATNVQVDPYIVDTLFYAIDQNSFSFNDGSGWSALPPVSFNPAFMPSCESTEYALNTVVNIPEVLPGDTVRMRFATYYCQPVCKGFLPRMRVAFQYNKVCPPETPVGGKFNFYPDTTFLRIRSGVKYELEDCLQDGQTYTLDYWLASGRLTQDTGFLQVLFELPLGITWDPNCPFTLGGQTPLESGVTPNPDGSSQVRILFDLPMTTDSVFTQFCVTYNCNPDMVCVPPVPDIPPRGADYTVFPPPSDCGGCQLKLTNYSLFSNDPNDNINCAISYCEPFVLVVNDDCVGGGGGGGGGGLDGLAIISFDSYRINFGYQDNNDDRKADNTSAANAPGVRRDRYMVGDTLRSELKAMVLTGSLSALSFRVFMESWMTDFNQFDGDAYDIANPLDKPFFLNYDTTSFIGAHLRIKTAGGQVYDCEIGVPGIRSDQHIYQIAEPNVRPPQIVDIVTNMFHQYDLDLTTLPCLPANFALSPGDSLIFWSDYKFENNYTPMGSNLPPLINFRNSICDLSHAYSWKLEDGCTQKVLGQYSGYREIVNPNTQRIEPCAPSTELSPFQYAIRLARGNMFPFEVRPLSTVTQYSYSLPTNVGLLETNLDYLTLQDNFPVFGLTPVSSLSGGDSMTLDLSQFFIDPLDEGYSMEISTVFDTTCGYNGTKFGRTVLGLKYPNLCFHNPIEQTYYVVNPNGYINGSPKIEFFSTNTVVQLPTDNLEYEFFLRNNSQVDAPNAWLSITSDGDLADLQLELITNGQIIPATAGVYQLGSMEAFAQWQFRVTGKNLSCKPVTVTFQFGWDCAPVFNPNGDACGTFVQTIELRAQPPELELTIENQPVPLPLCQPSGYFEFEVSNANDGTAFNLAPSIKLPPGISIVPGSCQLSYPAGSPFVNLSDPAELAGNVYVFDPESASSLLAQNGLISADEAPLNALRIRFRVLAECGAVANAQPIYGAESVQACGVLSNVLRKPGDPITIDGVEPGYSAIPNINFANPPGIAECGEDEQLSITIAVNGTPTTGDSIYVLLPAGTSYVTGSYQQGLNAPAGPPKVSGNQIQLPMPLNLGAGALLEFNISIRYDDPAGCADKLVVLQTRQKTEAFCQSSNQFCDVYVVTGESLLDLNAQNPELLLSNFEMNTQGGQTTFNATLENLGSSTASNPVVQIYNDQNGNGQIDPGDPLVTTVTVNGNIQPNGVLPINGNLNNLPASAFCDLIALIPAELNCACGDHVFPLDGKQVVTTGIGLCDLQAVNVGTPEVQGNTYTWITTAGMSCVNCANATYTPGPDVQPGELVTLILEEKAGDCTVERKFEIQFGGNFGIEGLSQTICQGESATLEATAGGANYNWSGPGISTPNQQIQVVQPANSAVYSVTVTFAGGCTGTGTVSVTVNPATNIQLGPITTCEGDPVNILGQVTDVPGIYKLELQKVNGCDSIITQELIVTKSQTSSVQAFCAGGSAMVFDSVFTTSGNLCRTFTSTTGCDSTHCVTVNEVPNPQAPEQDSALVVALGESITIETPNNYATYEWIPFDPAILSCSDCPDPVATVDSSTRFLLVITDGNGCPDTVEYRIFVCDAGKVYVPNAFTPNGDGSNDLFRVVPHEGAEVIQSLRVFDRWGQKLYEGTGASAQWDGKIGDKPAPSDVYVWILEYQCGENSVREKGDVTLLR